MSPESGGPIVDLNKYYFYEQEGVFKDRKSNLPWPSSLESVES